MKILGYIVQYLDEESLTPNGPGKRLFTDFQEALNHAHELIHTWHETNTPQSDGPIEYNKTTKQMVDAQHSALVFRSREVFIWIEIVFS